jgi:hypothetical protein
VILHAVVGLHLLVLMVRALDVLGRRSIAVAVKICLERHTGPIIPAGGPAVVAASGSENVDEEVDG